VLELRLDFGAVNLLVDARKSKLFTCCDPERDGGLELKPLEGGRIELSWLDPGRDELFPLDNGRIGLSGGLKKLEVRRRTEGEEGMVFNVSIARSDNDGLDFRGVCVLDSSSCSYGSPPAFPDNNGPSPE
jgi:hypothetical protein